MFPNSIRLKQLRKSLIDVILQSPETIIIQRKPEKSDGFGNYVTDPFGIPTTLTLTVRISHERGNPENLKDSPAGLSTNLQRYILADYDSDIRSGDVFEALGRSWRIGPVDPLIKFGGTYGYQAPLIDATMSEEVTS